MRRLFESTVQQSSELVLEQVMLVKKKKAAPIILCSGLGSSLYIKIKFDEF